MNAVPIPPSARRTCEVGVLARKPDGNLDVRQCGRIAVARVSHGGDDMRVCEEHLKKVVGFRKRLDEGPVGGRI